MCRRRTHPSAAPTLEGIRAAVARGKADVEAGRTIDVAEAFAEIGSLLPHDC